ncbi:MAG: VWA domain-containing protein [Treponema sp.]|jgi:Ca-activated chloride channel family protein|nr:VWA domain-containing protein [Treponema sp.]
MISGQLTFDYPVVLGAFIFFIPLLLFDILSGFRRYKHIIPEELQKKISVSTVFFRVFIAFSIIALSGPRWGTGFTISEYTRGLDTVFAVDVSRSMDIRDAQTGGAFQSRLERGILIAKESTIAVSGARFAASIGRGKGYLAVPLTFDNEAVLSFLESLDGSSMTGRSTNLEALVEASANAFQNTSAARKVIVLVSDGEFHSGVFRNALNRCVREGVIVTAVAVGSDEGRTVPPGSNAPHPDTISKRDAAVMRMAAERTGGIYIDANREDAASVLSSHLFSLAQEENPGGSRTESKQRRTFFIILAIAAYGASRFIPRIFVTRKLPLLSMLAVVLIFTSCSRGKLLLLEANYLFSQERYDEAIVPYQQALNYEDSSPYAGYGLGLTLYSLDEKTESLDFYRNSINKVKNLSDNEHRELRYRNYYNSGIIYFEEGDFLLAADSFKEALRADPRRTDAKRNLEISLMSISMETNRENRTEERNENREVLFDYIKQQEQQYWKSREWTPEENLTGPDY